MEIKEKTGRLTEEEIAFYREEGYLLYNKPVFPEAKFQALQEYFDELLSQWPKDKRPEAMDVPHFTKPKLFEWLFADEVLDLVSPFLGDDIALFASHFICKPKGDGRRVPWHEDSAYWGKRLDPMEVVTVWLALDPSTEENGCMYVIPRTQDNGYSEYEEVDPEKHVFKREIIKGQFEETQAVPCILQPNEASLHDGKLIHGSPPNTSDLRRCGYTMRYISAATVTSAESREFHMTYLARGRDIAGCHDGDPTKSHTEFYQHRLNRHKGSSTGH